jgi:hypothetical protein
VSLHILAGLNILLGLAGFSWLLLRTTSRWSEYPTELRLLLLKALALFFCLLATSTEMYFRDQSLLVSTGVITATKTFALYTLWRTRGTKYRTGERAETARDSLNPNKDIPA